MADLLQPGGPVHTELYPLHPDYPEPLPDAAGNPSPRVRWRDLPPHEQLRRKVEDQLRYVGQRHGKLLTAAQLCDRMHWPERWSYATEPQVQIAIGDPVTIANLRALGLIADDVETWDEAVAGKVAPSRAQMDALDAILERLDPTDTRSLAEILREHGVQLKTWQGWLADPMFGAYVRDRSAAAFGHNAHEVDLALMRRASAGDVPAIKLILELQGRIRQAGDTLDVNGMLARVVEILQTEVTDEGTLLRIVERLEALAEQSRRGRLPTGPTVVAGELA